MRSLLRSTTANYEARILYTSQPQAIAQRLREDLNRVVAKRGLVVEDTLL